MREQYSIIMNNNNNLFLVSFLFLFFIFIFVLNFFLLNHQYEEKKIVINFSAQTSDYISKLEELQWQYKNNSLKKPLLFDKINTSKNFISLKKELNLSNNISKKKQDFIQVILPLVVNQNQKIIIKREKLINVKKYLNFNKTLNKPDQKFLQDLAYEYSVKIKNRHKIDIINDLLIRVDIIPNSIAVAQAANESGWGSSRFAREFNALFGEYTYDDKIGVVPSEREKGKKHLIRHFPSINKSVESYFLNLNTHYSYDKFRKLRKILRERKDILNVKLLMDKLDAYAQDHMYTHTLNSIIQDNQLTQYDNILFLSTGS